MTKQITHGHATAYLMSTLGLCHHVIISTLGHQICMLHYVCESSV